ncbi:MAG: GEVED domain-containing protein [Chloroflexota bacterium]
MPTYDLDNGTTNPNSETAVSLPNPGDSNYDADFGYRLNGIYNLSGTVYYDLDESGGDQGTSEPGYVGQTVYLWWEQPSGGYMLIGSTTTDANGDYSFPNLPNGNYVASTEATAPNLNNATHTTGSSNQNTGTAYEPATINNADVVDVDFGFFVATDFDDLPNSYNTNLSGGAYHVVTSTLHLGPDVDLEPNGAPGTEADQDGFDDGVARDMTDHWTPGVTVQIAITVTGGTGVVGGWFDWDNDGMFGAGEFVNFGTRAAGSYNVDVTIPGSYTTGQTVYARFRVFEPANIPGGSLTADDYNGGADGGEVEGYRWTFGVTAVSLQSLLAQSQPMPTAIFVLGLLLAGISLLWLRLWRQTTA